MCNLGVSLASFCCYEVPRRAPAQFPCPLYCEQTALHSNLILITLFFVRWIPLSFNGEILLHLLLQKRISY